MISQSNVGCEYWGVDLDNAMIDPTLNAAAQQYAIVVSNPQTDVPALVTVTGTTLVVGATVEDGIGRWPHRGWQSSCLSSSRS